MSGPATLFSLLSATTCHPAFVSLTPSSSPMSLPASRSGSMSQQNAGPIPFRRSVPRAMGEEGARRFSSALTGRSAKSSGGSKLPFDPWEPKEAPDHESPSAPFTQTAAYATAQSHGTNYSQWAPRYPPPLYEHEAAPTHDGFPQEETDISRPASPSRPRFVICVDHGTAYTGT